MNGKNKRQEINDRNRHDEIVREPLKNELSFHIRKKTQDKFVYNTYYL